MNCSICVFYAHIKKKEKSKKNEKSKKDEKKFIEYMHSSLELEKSFSIFIFKGGFDFKPPLFQSKYRQIYQTSI